MSRDPKNFDVDVLPLGSKGKREGESSLGFVCVCVVVTMREQDPPLSVYMFKKGGPTPTWAVHTVSSPTAWTEWVV